MKSLTEHLWFEVPSRRGFVNITGSVEALLRKSAVQEGLCLVNAMHITASVFIGRIRTPRWRAHLVVGVVALRPLRPRKAGGIDARDGTNRPVTARRPTAAATRRGLRNAPSLPRF